MLGRDDGLGWGARGVTNGCDQSLVRRNHPQFALGARAVHEVGGAVVVDDTNGNLWGRAGGEGASFVSDDWLPGLEEGKADVREGLGGFGRELANLGSYCCVLGAGRAETIGLVGTSVQSDVLEELALECHAPGEVAGDVYIRRALLLRRPASVGGVRFEVESQIV